MLFTVSRCVLRALIYKYTRTRARLHDSDLTLHLYSFNLDVSHGYTLFFPSGSYPLYRIAFNLEVFHVFKLFAFYLVNTLRNNIESFFFHGAKRSIRFSNYYYRTN